jgi:hypothetical protein
MTSSTHEDKRVSERDEFRQALMYRAAKQISLAVRDGCTCTERHTSTGGEVLTFVEVLGADPVSTAICIYVHEKTSERFVWRSDDTALDSVRRKDFAPEPLFDLWLDEVGREPRRSSGEVLRQPLRQTGME